MIFSGDSLPSRRSIEGGQDEACRRFVGVTLLGPSTIGLAAVSGIKAQFATWMWRHGGRGRPGFMHFQAGGRGKSEEKLDERMHSGTPGCSGRSPRVIGGPDP